MSQVHLSANEMSQVHLSANEMSQVHLSANEMSQVHLSANEMSLFIRFLVSLLHSAIGCQMIMSSQTGYPVDSRYSWLVAFVAALVYAVSPGIMRTLGIVLVEMEEKHGWSNSSLSVWMTALPFSLVLLAGPTSGFLLTKLALRTVTCVGLCLITIGYVMVAFCSSVYLLFLAFFLMGIGLNYSFIGAVVSTSAYFEAKRPTAVGLMSAGGGVGTFCIPLLARLLFDRLSYQEAVVFIGAIVLQACVPVMLIRPKAYWKNNEIMLTRSQEQKFCENGQANEAYVSQNKLSTKNANIQLEMDSGNTNHQDSPLACSSSTMAVFTTTPYSSDLLKVSKNSTKIKEPKLKETFLALVSSKPYILYVSACVLTAMGYSSIFILLPLFAKELGIPKYHVSYALSLYGGIEIPARIIHGALANQKFISSLTYLGMVLLIGSVGSLPLLLGETTATLYITCAVYALCLTCFMAFVPLVVLERIEKKYSSVAIGIVYGCEGVSAAIGYIVSPILHSYYSSWKAGIIMIAIAVCSGSLIMLITSCVFPVASTEGCNLNVFTLLKKKESTTSSNIEEDKSHKL